MAATIAAIIAAKDYCYGCYYYLLAFSSDSEETCLPSWYPFLCERMAEGLIEMFSYLWMEDIDG